jgi:haloacid dehalogenase-like hydrolase
MQHRETSGRWTTALRVVSILLATIPGRLAADPIRAVFFDLGDTLVEDVGGGMFGLRPGAAETVGQLQALGIELGIITNVPSDWTLEDLEAILVEPELLDEFSVVVLSSQAPAPKPDPAIYTFAHSQLAVPVAVTETAFVGENLGEIANDVDNPTQGCRAVGMIGIHLSDQAPSPLADYTIPTDDLPQVVAIVESVNGIFADGFESGDVTAWTAASLAGTGHSAQTTSVAPAPSSRRRCLRRALRSSRE